MIDLKIVILGRTKLLYDTAKLLIKEGHQIMIVVTCKEAPEYSVTSEDFRRLANSCGASFFQCNNLNELGMVRILRAAKADIAVSVNWINIIGDEVIHCFTYGILNAHAGDLPRYRGNACPNWAMLCGESKIAATIHFMESKSLDSGDILVKKFYRVSQKTTIGRVYEWLNDNIPKMFLEAIDAIGSNTGSLVKQSKYREDILRTYPRIPSDSLIHWDRDAWYIERLINASSEPFAGAYTFYYMNKLIIWKGYAKQFEVPSIAVPGQVVEKNLNTGEIGIACGNGIIVLREVQMEDRKRVAPIEIIHSLRERLGLNLEDEIYKLRKLILEITN